VTPILAGLHHEYKLERIAAWELLRSKGSDFIFADDRTHSSLMNEKGIDPKLVADQQGHTVDVNLNVYTRTSIESRLEAVETLASAFVN
jgi:hypothetical protein